MCKCYVSIYIDGRELELNDEEKELLYTLLSSTEMGESRPALSKVKAELRKEFADLIQF
jgi:hypothetical protein